MYQKTHQAEGNLAAVTHEIRGNDESARLLININKTTHTLKNIISIFPSLSYKVLPSESFWDIVLVRVL